MGTYGVVVVEPSGQLGVALLGGVPVLGMLDTWNVRLNGSWNKIGELLSWSPVICWSSKRSMAEKSNALWVSLMRKKTPSKLWLDTGCCAASQGRPNFPSGCRRPRCDGC